MNEEHLNNNYMPDHAFGDQQSTPVAEAFQTEDRASAFNQAAYNGMTIEQKLKLHKEAAHKTHSIRQAPTQPALTMAEQQVLNAESKVHVHADGSITVQKGTLGSDKHGTELMKILREQAY